MGAELTGHISRREKTIFGYAISNGNECLICGNYLKKWLADPGINDSDNVAFTDEEEELITFAEALAPDPNHVPDEIDDLQE